MIRIAWTVTSLVIVETVICGIALLPSVLSWAWLSDWLGSRATVRAIVLSVALIPGYVLFAICLLMVSPVVIRALGWSSPDRAEMPIAAVDWPLLGWVRYLASLHVARIMAGSLFRGTPLWTAHLRLHGARLGRRVYVNSLSISDYNLLECGDGVVIGGGVHMSGHTVEAGVVKTGRVRLGSNVTIGLGSVIEIDVEIGPNAQIGALSFVPKHAKLPGGVVYAGVPARPLVHHE